MTREEEKNLREIKKSYNELLESNIKLMDGKKAAEEDLETYKQRINNAIEFINQNTYIIETKLHFIANENRDKLVGILQGDNNEWIRARGKKIFA